MQRVDVARFFILFKYGGLYADLDTFPNLDRFPLVPLGLSKIAMDTKTRRPKPEWDLKVVVATEGNPFILEILEDMSRAMAKKAQCITTRTSLAVSLT